MFTLNPARFTKAIVLFYYACTYTHTSPITNNIVKQSTISTVIWNCETNNNYKGNHSLNGYTDEFCTNHYCFNEGSSRFNPPQNPTQGCWYNGHTPPKKLKYKHCICREKPHCPSQEHGLGRKLLQNWLDTLHQRSPEKQAALYSANGYLLPTVSNIPRKNRQEIYEYFVDFFPNKPTGKIETLVQVPKACYEVIISGLYTFDLNGIENRAQTQKVVDCPTSQFCRTNLTYF
eukprot:Pgem_evm1s250